LQIYHDEQGTVNNGAGGEGGGREESTLADFGENHANDCMNPSAGRWERKRTVCSCSCVLYIIQEQVTDFPVWLLTGIVHQLMPAFGSGL